MLRHSTIRPVIRCVSALFILPLLAGSVTSAEGEADNGPVKVTSPDGKLQMILQVSDRAGSKGCPVYRVLRGERCPGEKGCGAK